MTADWTSREGTALVVIDVQERPVGKMHEGQQMVAKVVQAVKAAQLLGIPILITEQYPNGLGRTAMAIRDAMRGYHPVEKTAFSPFGSPDFRQRLAQTGARRVILCGLEAHGCVLLAARDAVREGYQVEVLADAVTSRKPADVSVGLRRAEQEGACLNLVETCFLDMVRTAEAPEFKPLLELFK